MRKRAKNTRAFTLVEIVIAMGIAAFCLIPLLALLPVGLGAVKNSSHETIAVNILTSVVADLGNATSTSNSPIYKIPVYSPSATENTNIRYFDRIGDAVSSAQAAGFKLVLTYHSADASISRPQSWHASISWPAPAPDPEGLVETVFILPPKTF